MLCSKSLLPRFSSRPGEYKACSAWKKVMNQILICSHFIHQHIFYKNLLLFLFFFEYQIKIFMDFFIKKSVSYSRNKALLTFLCISLSPSEARRYSKKSIRNPVKSCIFSGSAFEICNRRGKYWNINLNLYHYIYTTQYSIELFAFRAIPCRNNSIQSRKLPILKLSRFSPTW